MTAAGGQVGPARRALIRSRISSPPSTRSADAAASQRSGRKASKSRQRSGFGRSATVRTGRRKAAHRRERVAENDRQNWSDTADGPRSHPVDRPMMSDLMAATSALFLQSLVPLIRKSCPDSPVADHPGALGTSFRGVLCFPVFRSILACGNPPGSTGCMARGRRFADRSLTVRDRRISVRVRR